MLLLRVVRFLTIEDSAETISPQCAAGGQLCQNRSKLRMLDYILAVPFLHEASGCFTHLQEQEQNITVKLATEVPADIT